MAALPSFLGALLLAFGGVSARAALKTEGIGSQLPDEVLKARDPFKRPPVVASNERPKSDLENYPVENFKMIGVLTGPLKMRAMLLAPNSKTYFVHESMKIGQRKGVITKITSESVLVRERVVNVLGQEESVDIEIKLQGGKGVVGGEGAPASSPAGGS